MYCTYYGMKAVKSRKAINVVLYVSTEYGYLYILSYAIGTICVDKESH